MPEYTHKGNGRKGKEKNERKDKFTYNLYSQKRVRQVERLLSTMVPTKGRAQRSNQSK